MQLPGFADLLEVIKKAEVLKRTTRHSWTSDPTRRESVAEHVWQCSLLLILLKDQIGEPFDLARTLTMLVVHDLGEAVTEDIPEFYKKDIVKEAAAETAGFTEVFSSISDTDSFREYADIYNEFNAGQTTEARIAKSIDKLEVQIQHNLTDINKTWDANDYRYALTINNKYHKFNPFLKVFKDQIDQWTVDLVTENNTQDLLPQDELKAIKKNKKN